MSAVTADKESGNDMKGERLTDEQITALADYAATRGRNWKASLRRDWMEGRTTGVLQELRNSLNFGPRGLTRYNRNGNTYGEER